MVRGLAHVISSCDSFHILQRSEVSEEDDDDDNDRRYDVGFDGI